MKVLITGASGLLGGDLVARLQGKYQIAAIMGSKDLDVTDVGAVYCSIRREKPDVVIHSAAWRDIDRAEQDRRSAFAVNAIGTRHVAGAAKAVGSRIVYISSDSVFPGLEDYRYLEFDQTGPISVYGRTKLAGELITRETSGRHYILRVPLLFGHCGMREQNNILGLVDKIRSGQKVKVAFDQAATPTYTYDIADVIANLIETDYFGTYHIASKGLASRYEFAREILDFLKIDTSLLSSVSRIEANKLAPRQVEIALDTLAIETTLEVEMPHWQQALHTCLEAMKTQKEL